MSAAGMASAGVRFFMLLAAMLAAFMMLPMMAALHGGVICERAVEQSRNRVIRISRCAAIKPDPASLKCTLCTRADSAADEKGDPLLLQDHRQRLMAAHGSIQVFSCRHLSVFNGEEFKHFCVAEVLEHLAVFRCYCKFHF